MKIELLKFKQFLKTDQIGSKSYVFDPIRKKYIVLTPEELTRQLLIQYLIKEKKYRSALLQVEKQLLINGLRLRFDIVAFDRKFAPFLLVECKSHRIKIRQKTYDQISRYNQGLRSPYILVSNGIDHQCYHVDYINKKVNLLNEIPSFTI